MGVLLEQGVQWGEAAKASVQAQRTRIVDVLRQVSLRIQSVVFPQIGLELGIVEFGFKGGALVACPKNGIVGRVCLFEPFFER